MKSNERLKVAGALMDRLRHLIPGVNQPEQDPSNTERALAFGGPVAGGLAGSGLEHGRNQREYTDLQGNTDLANVDARNAQDEYFKFVEQARNRDWLKKQVRFRAGALRMPIMHGARGSDLQSWMGMARDQAEDITKLRGLTRITRGVTEPAMRATMEGSGQVAGELGSGKL